MRRISPFGTTVALLLLTLQLSAPATFADDAAIKSDSDAESVSTSKVVRGDAASGRDRPRKLAMVSTHAKTDSKQPSKTDSLSFGGGWRPQIPETITIKVPRDVHNAADVCIVCAKRAAIHAQKNAGEMYKWLGRFFRQMHSPPVVTPGGAWLSNQPVQQTPAKLYFTHEGRLKTVISR